MNKKFTFFLFAGMLLFSTINAQLSSDQKTVLTICLQVAELSDQNHIDSDGNAILTILNNEVVPIDTSLKWFSNNIAFRSFDDLVTEGVKAYIDFKVFDVDTSNAEAEILYQVIGGQSVKIRLSLSKSESVWCITSNYTEVI